MKSRIKHPCEYPFTGIYIIRFHKGDQRWRVSIKDQYGAKIDMLLSRYRMCVKMGRVLDTKEEVHHIDDDKLNDDIDNLEVLSASDHARLHSSTGISWVELTCQICRKQFNIKRTDFLAPAIRNGQRTFCSKSCRTTFTNANKPIKNPTIVFKILEIRDNS